MLTSAGFSTSLHDCTALYRVSSNVLGRGPVLEWMSEKFVHIAFDVSDSSISTAEVMYARVQAPSKGSLHARSMYKPSLNIADSCWRGEKRGRRASGISVERK